MRTHTQWSPVRPAFFLGLSPLLILASSLTAAANDPLFMKMAGIWKGEGLRIQLNSGRRIRIEARTRSTVEGDKLVSRNEIQEFALDAEGNPSGAPKAYARTYWIRPNLVKPGFYEFGTGEGLQEIITSQGQWEGGILEVEQSLGGEPPFVIRSRTRFEDDASLYSETAWHGENQLTETRIEYRRLRALR